MNRRTAKAFKTFVRVVEFHLARTNSDAEGKAEIRDACEDLVLAILEGDSDA